MQLFILLGIILLLVAVIIYQAQVFERASILNGSKKLWLWIDRQKIGPYTAVEIAAKWKCGEFQPTTQFFFDGTEKMRNLSDLKWVLKRVTPVLSEGSRTSTTPEFHPLSTDVTRQTLATVLTSIGLLGVGLGMVAAAYFAFFFAFSSEGVIDVGRLNDRTLGFAGGMVSIVVGTILLATALIRHERA